MLQYLKPGTLQQYDKQIEQLSFVNKIHDLKLALNLCKFVLIMRPHLEIDREILNRFLGHLKHAHPQIQAVIKATQELAINEAIPDFVIIAEVIDILDRIKVLHQQKQIRDNQPHTAFI